MTGEQELRVSIVRGGGVGGFVTRAELSSAALGPDDRRQLHRAVAGSGLRQLAGHTAGAPAHPDELRYRIAVTSPHGAVAADFCEHELTPPLRTLIDWVEGRPQVERTVGAAGGD